MRVRRLKQRKADASIAPKAAKRPGIQKLSRIVAKAAVPEFRPLKSGKLGPTPFASSVPSKKEE